MPDRDVAQLLILGGGPAGFSAARSYRSNGGSGRLVMLTHDPDAPYNRPPLSKDYLRGESLETDLPLAEPGEFDALSVKKVFDSAVVLDPGQKLVRTTEGAEFTYHSCILALGSVPSRLPVPGADDPGVLTLRTLADARLLRTTAAGAATAIVIGSGFIGCEAAVSLSRLGLRVHQVSDEPGPQHRRLGPQVAAYVRGWLEDEGVQLITSASVSQIKIAGHSSTVQIDGADDVHADLVLMAVGVTPSGGLASEAGLSMDGPRVITDARMRTSCAGVLAAGDVAKAYNAGAGRHLAVEHWGEAERMGQIAGATAGGADDEWSNPPGFWSQIGDHTLKYAAWGDGYEQVRVEDHGGGAFTAWYTDASGAAVGVLTHDADEDYENGQHLVESGKQAPRL